MNKIFKNKNKIAGTKINNQYIPKYIKVIEDISYKYCDGELFRIIILDTNEMSVLDGDTIKKDYIEVRK